MSKTAKTRKPMSARSKGLIALILLAVLTVFVSCISIGGMKLDGEGVNILLPWVPVSSENWPASLPLSRALGGGSYVEYTAALPEGSEKDLAAVTQAAADIIKERLQNKGVTDASVKAADGAIRVELPDLSADVLENVLALISAPGQIEFRTPDGETFMTGADVKSAGVGYANQNGTSYALGLNTTEEGKQKLADATTANVGSQISIYRDGALLVSASVGQAFTTGEISVPMGLSLSDTVNVALQINSGAMDVTLTQAETGALNENGRQGVKIALIVVAVVLALALIYLLAEGRLTGLSGMWAVWCGVIIEMFFFATLVRATLTVGCLITLVLGLLLAIYTAVVRAWMISRETAKGAAAKSAVKTGCRAAAKLVWLAHGGLLVIALLLMLIPGAKIFGYTLSAGVVASAAAAPLMRLFQVCFLAISQKPALFGKAK